MLWNALLPNKLITRSYIDMKQVSSLFSYVYKFSFKVISISFASIDMNRILTSKVGKFINKSSEIQLKISYRANDR